MSAAQILIVAGHDPSGGAGLLVDLQTAKDFGVGVSSCVTAWTDQDATAVRAIGARPAQEWLAEASALLSPALRALKFGLLPGLASLRAAAQLMLRARACSPTVAFVLDPVIAASSGRRFLEPAEVSCLRAELLPLGVILTPNLPEIGELSGHSEATLETDRRFRSAAAQSLLAAGAAAVMLKGGHLLGPWVQDLLAEPGGRLTWIEHARRARGSLRGSGCRHATALACELALGRPLAQAALTASRTVAELLPLPSPAGALPPA